MREGKLIVFEGLDGSGKTTCLNSIQQALQKEGYSILITREPGGTPAAEAIRKILLDPALSLSAKSEALLFAAARAEHLQKTILPALKEGRIILCDRFLDSSLAYQGVGRKLGISAVLALNDYVLHGFRPDLVLYFKAPLELLARRKLERGQMDRLDLQGMDFEQRVEQGYASLDHMIVIDASKSEQEVYQQAKKAIDALLKERPENPESRKNQQQKQQKQ